jgi:hypothetical protein
MKMADLVVMSFDRSLWGEAFSPDHPPQFPCPTCYFSHRGRLAAELSDLHIEVPAHVAQQPHLAGLFPIFGPRFRLTMRCDAAACGEVVTVAGTVAPWETEVDGEHVVYAEALFPAFFFPAPPIIAASDAQDGRTGELLQKSFELFWVDSESCMNCVRRFIEGTLDNFGVPRTRAKKGKQERRSLADRINIFVDTDETVAETFGPLRKIGNMGSHGEKIERTMMLDVYAVLDDCLRRLYDLSPIHERVILPNLELDTIKAKLRNLPG